MFAVMGLVAGILLTVVSKLFEVKTDPRTEEVNEALPQINCGACGYSGCSDYAKAIVEKGAPTNLCRPGGAKVAAKVNDIMGGDASMEISKEIAVVRCSGDCDTESTPLILTACRPVPMQSAFTAECGAANTAVSVWATA